MLFNHHQFYSIKKQLTTKSYLNDSNYFANLSNLMARQPKGNQRAYNFKLPLYLIIHLGLLACSVNASIERGKQNFTRWILL